MSCTSSCKRIATVGGKTSDMFSASIAGGQTYHGYVLSDLGIGGGDYLNFKFCMDCGQIQGKFPLPPSELESEKSNEE